MLRIRRIRVSDAVSVAGDVLDDDLSPQAFTRAQASPDNRANAMWLGFEEALRPLGLTNGGEVTVERLAAVLRTSRGAFDLTFWAPSSVSWVWATTDDAKLRADLERAMVTATNDLLAYLIENQRWWTTRNPQQDSPPHWRCTSGPGGWRARRRRPCSYTRTAC
jgi:hypothetical protein